MTQTATYEPSHALSKKSLRQRRNVFIWCTARDKVALGWHVGDDSPVTISTAYRWITAAVEARCCDWREANTFTLCPVEVRPSNVLSYSVHKNGTALPRDSQDIIAPGDYGLYTTGDGSDPRVYFVPSPVLSFSRMESFAQMNSPALLSKASLTPSLVAQATDRDHECVFSGVPLGRDSDELVASWIFPPFLGYKLSDDDELIGRYFAEPETCDLNELMVIENVICGRKDIIALFWENKLGVDVDDNHRIIVFEGAESLNGDAPLKTHLTLSHGSDDPNDRFLRLHFQECLSVSVCRGDVLEDYKEQEIENFMEELGVYDNEIDSGDPRWLTELGSHVHAYLVRQRMAGHM